MEFEQLVLMASIAIIAFIGIAFAVIGLNKSKHLQSEIEKLSHKVDVLQKQTVMQKEELHEVRSGALAVGNKVKDLVVKVDLLNDKVQEVEYLDPETRLYAQAAKMVEAGASVDELMQECELPRAEAELLLSVKTTR